MSVSGCVFVCVVCVCVCACAENSWNVFCNLIERHILIHSRLSLYFCTKSPKQDICSVVRHINRNRRKPSSLCTNINFAHVRFKDFSSSDVFYFSTQGFRCHR